MGSFADEPALVERLHRLDPKFQYGAQRYTFLPDGGRKGLSLYPTRAPEGMSVLSGIHFVREQFTCRILGMSLINSIFVTVSDGENQNAVLKFVTGVHDERFPGVFDAGREETIVKLEV